MAATRSIQNFYELRTALKGARDLNNEVIDMAIAFLDNQGIAMGRRPPVHTNGNGNGHKPGLTAALRTQLKTRLQTRSKSLKTRGDAAAKYNAREPDGQHLSMLEAAKILKCSDANVRLMAGDGRLPKPTYERRMSKKKPGMHNYTMVVPRAAVLAYAKGLSTKLQSKLDAVQEASTAPKKPKKYVHWMQLPKNKAKMMARVKVMQRAAAAKRAGAAKKEKKADSASA